MPELRLRDRILHATAGWHTTTDPACVHYKPTREGSGFDARCRGVECKTCTLRRMTDADGRRQFEPSIDIHVRQWPQCIDGCTHG